MPDQLIFKYYECRICSGLWITRTGMEKHIAREHKNQDSTDERQFDRHEMVVKRKRKPQPDRKKEEKQQKC